MIPIWTERNKWIKDSIPNDKSIIDWGCGNKDILRYINPPKYLGIDCISDADIIVDLNKEIPIINEKYNVGLVLGLLEYLDNPQEFLNSIKSTADIFLILILSTKKKKAEWKSNFSVESFNNLIIPTWKKVSFERNRNYILAVCRD